MMTSRRNTAATPALVGNKKKPRKPYTISRPREKWSGEEHERFVRSLLMFGRDWKTIAQFVGTKTATQIRSHAQKFFLKAHKLGFAAALPPPHPRRADVLLPPPQPHSFDDATPVTMTSSSSAGARQSVDWAWCWPGQDDSFMAAPNSDAEEASAGGEALFAECLLRDDTVVQLPLSPGDLRFAEVYRFVGDVFGSGASRPVEAHLQSLHGVDPVVAETILLVLGNLQDNLCAY